MYAWVDTHTCRVKLNHCTIKISFLTFWLGQGTILIGLEGPLAMTWGSAFTCPSVVTWQQNCSYFVNCRIALHTVSFCSWFPWAYHRSTSVHGYVHMVLDCPIMWGYTHRGRERHMYKHTPHPSDTFLLSMCNTCIKSMCTCVHVQDTCTCVYMCKIHAHV